MRASAISVDEKRSKTIKQVLGKEVRFEMLNIESADKNLLFCPQNIDFFFVGCDYRCELQFCLKKFIFLSEYKKIPFLMINPLCLRTEVQLPELFLISGLEDYTFTADQEKILDKIKAYLDHSIFSGRLFHPSSLHYKVLEVQRIILSNPGLRGNVSSLAARVNLSLSWLSSKFKEISGVPLETFILKKKLCYSLWKIISTQEPIKTIALEIGYRPLSFSKRFHDFYGVAPSAIRKRPSFLLS